MNIHDNEFLKTYLVDLDGGVELGEIGGER
jgi:hypothetical protein